jgi:hypothetical protein
VDNTFLQPSATAGTTLVMYVPPGVAAGQYPVTVTGISGKLSETAGFTLKVTAAAAKEK